MVALEALDFCWNKLFKFSIEVVDSGGKVGIGTTSPRGKLDVNGDMFGYNIYGDWIGNRSGKSFSIGANGGYAIDIDTNNVLNLRKGIKIISYLSQKTLKHIESHNLKKKL